MSAVQLTKLNSKLIFNTDVLKELLPDIESTLFFAQLYRLNAQSLGVLIGDLFNTPLATALTKEGGLHSNLLQDYLIDIGYQPMIREGAIIFGEVKPKGEILPEVWKSLEVEIADSIQAVGDKLESVIGDLEGRKGHMILQHMQILNAKRPTIGDVRAHVQHKPQVPNLIVFDVSGSVAETTVRALVDDVVALAWQANAHLAIVSNTCTHWQPGEYTVEAVLQAAEYMGTHYEELAPLFDTQQWGTVVTIADYDSSYAVMSEIKKCQGSIQQLLDISLVWRPTFLSEVLGQLSKDTKSMLISSPNMTF